MMMVARQPPLVAALQRRSLIFADSDRSNDRGAIDRICSVEMGCLQRFYGGVRICQDKQAVWPWWSDGASTMHAYTIIFLHF